MNNDPLTPALNDAVLISSVFTVDEDLPTDVREKKWDEYRRRVVLKQKDVLLDDLLRSLDLIFFLMIAIVHYLDCSLWLFILRYIIQLSFVSPNSLLGLPHFRAVFLSNTFCMLLHLLRNRPSASEVTRGYLHGGVLIDFIGQKGPVPKTRLVVHDLSITVLQLLMIAVQIRKAKIGQAISGNATAATSQDADAEERGVRRSEDSMSDTNTMSENDIELQDLSHRVAETATETTPLNEEDGNERAHLLSSTAESTANIHQHPLDIFMTGQTVVAEAYLVDLLQDGWRQYRTGAPSTIATNTLRAASTGHMPFPFLPAAIRARMGAAAAAGT